MTFVAELEPQILWRHFDTILTIPRPSKEEGRMRTMVHELASQKGLEHETDAAGNVVVRKPASRGHESAPITVLQSHLDMVTEKNSDVRHDFATDPIRPRRDGGYLKATGTTLGSDNGIGVAAMLAVLEDASLTHGPLELLFTVDEETGLTGAQQLDGRLVRGRRLLNLDSEEEGAVYVGCAGGAESALALPLGTAASPPGGAALRLRLHGLQGGHSGVDIHRQRGNAIQLLARCVLAATRGTGARLAAFTGGGKHNAIPREAFATVVLPGNERTAFTKALEAEGRAVREEFRAAEPGLQLETSTAEAPTTAWDNVTTARVLALLTGLPHGVLAMSYDIPGLVETSTNLATVDDAGGTLSVRLSSRSSVASALRAVQQRIRSIGELAGAAVEEFNGYPGWKPNLASPLLEVLKRVHERELGVAPEVKAIHAGLECGIIGEKVSGMDMISFGPQIEFPHSPDERVGIDSVGRFYRLLTATLEELARSPAA